MMPLKLSVMTLCKAASPRPVRASECMWRGRLACLALCGETGGCWTPFSNSPFCHGFLPKL